MNKSKNDLNKIKKKINSTLKYFEKNKSLDKKILENFINDINEMQKGTSLQQENFFRTTLYSIGDGVITTDLNGKIQQMNPVAEKLCGWKESEAKNKSFESVFKIIAEITKVKSENPVKRVLKSKHTVGLANHTLLISKTGKKIPIADSSSPIKNDKGKIIGVIIVFRDQTREREKENTLEERERKYSTLVSNLPGFIYQCKNDKDWTMEFISDGCKKITGYTPSDFIKNNKIAFNDIIHPDYKKTIWNKWQKILKERTYFEFEYPIIAKNGKLKWIWERGRGVYSTNGKLIFLEGFIEDISERRNAEESLRLKNIVFESSITANSIANLEGKLIDANAAFLNFWGYKSKSKVLGKSLNVFIKSKNDVVKILSTLNKKGVWEGDFLAKRSDRSEFIAHGLATTVVDNKGKIIGYQSSVLDVTDRNRTEALLKESENRYKIFFDNSPDAIFLADPESGEIVNANKAALQLLKMSYSKVVGMHQSQLHPKRLEDHAVKGFEEHKKENELIKPIENYVLTASGEEIPVEVLANTLKINGKTVIQGVFRNISERRRIEKALKESENKFQLFFEHSKDAMLLLDGNVFFDCNNAAVEMLGYNNKSEMLSAHPSKLSPDFQPDGTASFTKAEKIMNQAYKDGFVRFEWTHRKMNGEDLPVEVMLTSIPLAGKQILFTVWRDITERKTIESEIQRSRERMQLLVEGTPHLFFYVQNLDGKIEYISPSVENITGYSVSEWHNQNTWFITDSPINQNARKRTWEHLSGIINNDPVYAEILHANGSKVMIEIYERPIIKEGKVLGLHGVAHDISERIRFEQNLKESEISYRGLFNSVSEAIYILDENGIFIDINEGALEMYGYGRNELIGKTPEFVSAPNKNDLSSVAAALGKAFEGEKQQFEFWGKRKNGEEFLKDVRLYLGTYLNKKVCIAIANDITEKRKAEELLRESEKRYKLIAENTADSIAIFDLNLNYTYISPSVINLLGYSPEELMSIGLANIISEDAKNIIQKVLLEELENEINRNADPHRSRIIETEQLRKDGSKIWVEGTVSFLRDDNGNPIGILAVSRDVSSRKLVEAALASSEERYRAISTLTSDYLFSTLINDQGIHELVWIAGSFEKITGYTFEEYKRIGGWRATLHPSELELDNLDLDALNRNEKVNREIKTYHKNGSLVWVRSHAQPIWDFKYNKLIGVYGAVEDITHRKQTEIIQKIQYNIADAVVTYKTLTELFEIIRIELSALINVNNFFIALYDEKTGMLSSDVDKDEIEEIETWPAKGSMTGYVIEQKKSILLTKSEILQLINTGTAGMIGVIPEIWLGVPFKVSGKVIGVLVVQSYDNPYAYNLGSMEVLEIVAHELSIYIQHKKAEAETLKLSAAIVQSPTIVVITDPTGNIEYANPKFSEITGYSLEEAKGNNPKILKSGKHKSEFYTGLWKTILSGKTWHGEFQNKKKNGELYWENALIAPLIDSDGNITNFVAVKEDITEKKKMIEELIIAKEKAEEMNRIKSSFFANMSHELRTPMVGILGFSEVLMSELKDNPDYLHMISSINTSGQRLLETLNLILNLSKLEASKVVANLKTQDIIPILKESFGFFKSAADKKGLKYSFTAESTEIFCDVDHLLFTSIFNNLINNAIKFTDDGSVTLKVDSNNKNVVIAVIDTGVGISEEKQNLIWEEFRQASEGYNRSFEGTGLGLTIARKYTDIMHGTVSAKSTLGKGTTFEVSFPISKQIAETPKVEKPNNTINTIDPAKTLAKILYIEDDEISVKYVTTILKGLYTVDWAKDSDEAIAKTKQCKYEVLLMDINLRRGMDGLELTKVIRKMADYKSTPIVAITAFAMGREKEEFLSKGMTHYLSKPFVKNQLLSLLDSLLDKK
ncbi:MAG: PAS domain S-box protein [Ignavibacterium sp.]|nr:PAS domain S-box protein [Ignavibacterium sp.]